MPEHGSLENPALSCFDLSLLGSVKTSEPTFTGDMETGGPSSIILSSMHRFDVLC